MTTPKPRVNPYLVCTAAVVLALLFCTVSAFRAMPLWESAFRSDNSAVSWLSSALLLANAVMAIRLGLDGALPKRLAVWLAVAVFVLALDEQFMLHEYWQYRCQVHFEICRTLIWVQKLPTLLVGIVGVLTAFRLHRHLQLKSARRCLFIALAVGVWAILVDQMEMPQAIAVFEEAFEVFSEAIFLGVLLSSQATTET